MATRLRKSPVHRRLRDYLRLSIATALVLPDVVMSAPDADSLACPSRNFRANVIIS
jgi:hypothetical protein